MWTTYINFLGLPRTSERGSSFELGPEGSWLASEAGLQDSIIHNCVQTPCILLLIELLSPLSRRRFVAVCISCQSTTCCILIRAIE